MSEYVDKTRNVMQQGKGKVQETAGRVTDDRSLQARGEVTQGAAKTKKFGERIKDFFRN